MIWNMRQRNPTKDRTITIDISHYEQTKSCPSSLPSTLKFRVLLSFFKFYQVVLTIEVLMYLVTVSVTYIAVSAIDYHQPNEMTIFGMLLRAVFVYTSMMFEQTFFIHWVLYVLFGWLCVYFLRLELFLVYTAVQFYHSIVIVISVFHRTIIRVPDIISILSGLFLLIICLGIMYEFWIIRDSSHSLMTRKRENSIKI